MNFEAWKSVQLGDISKNIAYGYTESASDKPIGPKFLRITDIVNGLQWNTVPYCKITDSNFKKYQLEVGDIVIARTGATTGTAEIIKEKQNAVFASYLIRYKIDEAKANPFYIGYVLKSSIWKSFVTSIIGGSAQPGANAKQFASFELLLPNISTQTRIAAILTSLDDKIELNRQTNATLEAMAQTLFQEMCLPKKGEDMEGWREGKLGDVLTVKGGTTPSTKQAAYWNGTFHWVTPKDLSPLKSPVLLDSERKITQEGLKQISSGLLPKGTLLMSSRAPIGYFAISQIPVAINQGFIAINGTKVSNLFMLFWLKEHLDLILSRANGSTFLEISKSVFKEIELMIPERSILMKFDHLVQPLFEKIANNEQETQTLTTLRDSLLPKLMRGEIAV